MDLEDLLSKSIDAEHRGGSSSKSDEASVMEAEQRGRPIPPNQTGQPGEGRSLNDKAKPYQISKHLVLEAYKRVKANKGSCGVDGESLKAFEGDLKNNLYKLWNRLSSGSYHPMPVLRVEIPKGNGDTRILGVPTVSDRIAQMVVKMEIEPELERLFHPSSFGYRPNRSAHDALKRVRHWCRKRAWVLDMDIKEFFDTIDHSALMGYVDRHVKESWHRLYIERWLTASMVGRDGEVEEREQGTPQGGVISPLLANLYLHYVFDEWVEKELWGDIQFERYADDIVCHCTTKRQAEWFKSQAEKRFREHGLSLHPSKTKIVYCKSQYRQEDFEATSFDFLGYTFRPHWTKTREGSYGLFFYGEMSKKSTKVIRNKINAWPWRVWLHQEIKQIRQYCANKIRGWMNYFSLFGEHGIRNVLFHVDRKLSRWAKRKYKAIKTIRQAANRVNRARKNNPHWFAHWSPAI